MQELLSSNEHRPLDSRTEKAHALFADAWRPGDKRSLVSVGMCGCCLSGQRVMCCALSEYYNHYISVMWYTFEDMLRRVFVSIIWMLNDIVRRVWVLYVAWEKGDSVGPEIKRVR